MLTADAVFSSRQDHCYKRPAWLLCAIALMIGLCLLIIFFIVPAWFQMPAWAQKEVTSKSYRYSEREWATRNYDRYEVKPRTYPVFVRGVFRKEKQLYCHPLPKRLAAGNIWLTPTGASNFMNA
jgi:hypothetical protein